MKRFLVGVVIMFVITSGLAAGFFFGVGYYLSPQNSLAKADAVVAISGGETTARTAEAIRLYKTGWAPTLIFSGAAADANGPSNAQSMAKEAIAAGVPPTAVYLDELAANTRQNAAGVAKIVKDQDLHSIILVTSPYHQRRASITFGRALGQGFPILNHSSYDAKWRRSHWWATPTSRALTFAELQKVAYEMASGQTK